MIDLSFLQTEAQALLPEIIQIRRHIHAHPELSFQETETMRFIASVLEKEGISFKSGVGNTGIVAEICGTNPESRLIALRSDHDALPILEKNEIEFASKNKGVMHACGHDVHTACLLGAAKILNKLKDRFQGKVRLIFQPGEEKLPGGATLMIAEGVLKNPVPDFIVGLHVFPELEVGKVGFKSGMYMASTDELYLKVIGKGGHAALPEQYNNPLLIAAAIIQELNNKFMVANSELNLEKIPTVLAFGKITGAGATNVIPDFVHLEGTFRTMNEEWRKKAHEVLIQTANSIAKSMGGSVEFTIEKGYPFLVNDPTTTEKIRSVATDLLGKENVTELKLRMTAEDFAWYSQEIPSCFFRLGTRNESKGIVSPVHTATFDVDEDALRIGMMLMAGAVFA